MLVDQFVIKHCVERYLASSDTNNTLVSRLTSELRNVVEETVRNALISVNREVKNWEVSWQPLLRRCLNWTSSRERGLTSWCNTHGETSISSVLLRLRGRTPTLSSGHCVVTSWVWSCVKRLCPRKFINSFISYQQWQHVYRANKKLKGFSITIREDLTSSFCIRFASKLWGTLQSDTELVTGWKNILARLEGKERSGYDPGGSRVSNP